MIPGLVTHLWQTTLFVAAAWLLALALRKNQAHVRYWVWFAVSAKFLVPFSLLVGLGTLVPRHAAPPLHPAWMAAVEQAGEPLALPAVAARTADRAQASYVAPAALALWACGFAAIAICWLVRWKRIHAVRRSATPLRNRKFPVPVMSSPGLLEPGVFGILRPVLLLPEGIGERLHPAQLDAVLAHELCHVRRRDNLTSAIHMAVQAIFWFHDMVWWLGARLLDERERACDEEVLRLGSKPQIYAAGILNVCKLYVESPAAWMSGVTGANLRRRIEQIMARRLATRLNLPRKLLLAGAALLALIGPVLTGVVSGPRLRAQPAAATFGKPSGPKFEVASVKPALDLRTAAGQHVGIKIDAVRADIGYWSIRQLILRAYGLPSYQLSGPEWMNSLRFDIAAKFPEGATEDQLPEMLQWLLAERFGLVAHSETKDLPVWALVAGKGGPKMKPTAPDPDEPARTRNVGRTLDNLWSYDKPFGLTAMTNHGQRLEFSKMPMDALAQILADRLREPVIDRTGLEGDYQVTLDFSSAALTSVRTALDTEAPDPGSAVFWAAQRLGLKLERRKAPITLLIVDHVEKVPTGN